ncbi:CBS domain-containing protein [Psychrobacillus sp.]|uniref:CBS domain-containing protein n=1 Tax=Psychrobacillus sp. TaxID=1871623 RepID=UPI0028BEC25D|nr:CBS domain-containing protein [Psychrobacillus sp.]
MEVRNSDRFITAYNKINEAMKDITEIQEHLSFFRLIDLAKKKSAIIRKYEADLREYGDLRNAIIHHRTSTEYAIAEPHDDVVLIMEEISATLTKPITVGEAFQTKVTTFQGTDSLSYALKVIKERKYNQFPVYDGTEFRGLITPVGITKWLASTVDSESFSRKKTTLDEILEYENSRENHQFIKSDASIYRAEEMFKIAIAKGRRLEALLITDTGKSSEKLLGIITPMNMLQVD